MLLLLVGPLPMVLLLVALLAFIDYVPSSEALSGHGSGSHMPSWRAMALILIGLIGSTRQALAVGLAYPFRHPVFTAAQGALAGGAASLPAYLRSLARKSDGHAHDASMRGDGPIAQASADQALSPPEPVLVGLMSSFKQGLTVGSDCCFQQPVFIAAQGALADGVASLI
jgi:hypothetical protein